MIHRAKDLSPDQKQLIERLVGRSVLEDESISICAFEPPSVSDKRRNEIVNELKRYFAEIDANRKAVSPEEADELLSEAMRSTRPGYRSHQ